MKTEHDLYSRLLLMQPTQRKSSTLNAVNAVMNAVTMLVLQLLTTRVLGAEAAGRVSVDTATVLLCFRLGQLDMRPFQCTDRGRRFSFPDYFTLKVITACIMPVICLVYALIRGYGAERFIFCMALCVFKAEEVISDCFWGMLHQRERLDLAALGGAVYQLLGIAAFSAALLLTKRLDTAALCMAVLGLVHFLFYTLPLGLKLEKPGLSSASRILKLAGILIPLFAAGYCMNIVVTLPKYALDRFAGEAALGSFAAVFMPAQGVLLLCSILYYPRLTALAAFAEKHDRKGFQRLFTRMSAAIIALDLVIVLGGWLIGTPILSWLFHLDVAPYRAELVFILLGGGLFALYTWGSYALIAMRAQKGLLPLTLAVLAAGLGLNILLVPGSGLRGAALSYLFSMIFAALLILIKTGRALRRMGAEDTGSKLSRFGDLLGYVDPKSLLQIWKLPVAAVAALFVKRSRKGLWIVSEDAFEARDNGYWFFRYVREHHPDQPCVYAIHRSSPDFGKVAALGETVEYGSLKHWILYLASAVQISSQKSGDPNAEVFYFLQVYGLLKNRRLFLQHGVIKDDMGWLHYPETRIRRFLCGAFPEYEYIKSVYEYPEGYVRYTGLCRFDGLHHPKTDPQLILIMPTWRNWLDVRKDKLKSLEGKNDPADSEFFVKWRELLKDDALRVLADEYHVRFLFYPHRNMQQYLDLFPKGLPHVEICAREDYDVQDLLTRAALLLTDYSSVFFDMVYMKKPVIFYQFDYETFRKGQYPEGYFSYADNPFGKSCRSKEEVFVLLREAIENGCRVSEDFLKAHAEYFPLYDEENCRRACETAKELAEEGRRLQERSPK